MQRADSDIIASSQSIYNVYSFKSDTKVTKAALLQFCHMCCTIIPGSRRKSAFAGPQGLVGSAAVFDWPPISSEPAHPVPWSAANIHTHTVTSVLGTASQNFQLLFQVLLNMHRSLTVFMHITSTQCTLFYSMYNMDVKCKNC